MGSAEEEQAFDQLANLKISDVAGSKKENINLVSIGHVGISLSIIIFSKC